MRSEAGQELNFVRVIIEILLGVCVQRGRWRRGLKDPFTMHSRQDSATRLDLYEAKSSVKTVRVT
jgi:hypothetical protein